MGLLLYHQASLYFVDQVVFTQAFFFYADGIAIAMW